MKKQPIHLIGMMVLLAILTAACSGGTATQGAGSTKAPQSGGGLCDNQYIPAVEGATWTSTVHTDQGDSTQVDTITDAGTNAFLVETHTQTVDYVVTWSCTPNGLLWLQTNGGMFAAVFQGQGETSTWESVSHSGISLPKAIQPDDTWSSDEQLKVTNSTETTTYDIHIDFHAVGIESVSVPAGTFNAMRIDLTISWKSKYGEVSFPISDWFAPGVGLVKSSGTGTDLELTSYSIP